jgi:hypothetical protein
MSKLIATGSVWHYKDVDYVVNRHSFDILSQDPETGEWSSTVFYGLKVDPPATNRQFTRSASEWIRKFKDTGHEILYPRRR